ncbi:hypothetical protein [Fluoribacter gormanii]|uniref:hypothetical protein n=1 Tax=Fluoribacter gormanii TaxID=464 RepID=UPI001041362A|nr:hypothetical protein [Fluoribacter gormanii]
MKSGIIKMVFAIIMLIPVISTVSFVVQFTKQLHCSHEASSISLPEIKPIPWPSHGLITLWFSDAYLSQSSHDVLKLMDAKGFVAAIGVATHSICTYNHLSWKQLQTLQKKGWEITSLLDSNYSNLKHVNELAVSKNELRARGLGANNLVMLQNLNQQMLPEWLEYAKKYYLSCLRTKNQLNPLPVEDPYNLKAYVISRATKEQEIQEWIKAAQQNNNLLILVFHQIGTSKSDNDIGIQKFTHILDMIKQSQTPVVLPTQALGLVKSSPAIFSQ